MDETNDLKAKLREKLKASPFILMGSSASASAEPLTAQLADDEPEALWFFVRSDNRMARDGSATAFYASKGHDFFASLTGRISLDRDPARLAKLWSKPVEAWFPKGQDDPDLRLLRFDIGEAEMWESDLGLIGVFKLLTGKRLRPEEAGRHAIDRAGAE